MPHSMLAIELGSLLVGFGALQSFHSPLTFAALMIVNQRATSLFTRFASAACPPFGEARIGARTTMHHDHGRNAPSRLNRRFEHVPDQRGFPIRASKLHPFGHGGIAGRLRDQQFWSRRPRHGRPHRRARNPCNELPPSAISL
jgi:hypothetical protein